MEDRLLTAFRRLPKLIQKREVEMLELRASIYPIVDVLPCVGGAAGVRIPD